MAIVNMGELLRQQGQNVRADLNDPDALAHLTTIFVQVASLAGKDNFHMVADEAADTCIDLMRRTRKLIAKADQPEPTAQPPTEDQGPPGTYNW